MALTRETRSRSLAGEVGEAEAKAHSVAVLPFLDLDSAQADSGATAAAVEALRPALAQLGRSRVTLVSPPPVHWTGTGNVEEVRNAARQTDSRSILTGTIRRTPAGRRVTLHLISANGVDVLGHWMVEVPDFVSDPGSRIAQGAASGIYRVTGAPEKFSPRREEDPAWKTEPARAYMNSGRLLLDRRTIVDTDRAIASFEGAIAAEPQSVEARSYLAMACIGRNFLKSDPALVDRATEVSHEALAWAPDDPTAHRGLGAIYTFIGRNEEALEHCLRALESGDRSERAFGQIAYIWKQLGRPDKAIRWLRTAKVSPTQPADYEALIGDCWALLGEDERAAEAYQAAVRFRPDLPEGWLGLCHLNLVQGEAAKARALFQERSAEFAAFPAARHLQAQIEFFGRDYPAAEQTYRELHRADPLCLATQQYGAISFRSALARLVQQANPSEASHFLKESLEQDRIELARAPKNPETLYRLAAKEAVCANEEVALKYLAESITCGWIDYRSPRLDPRFDGISKSPRFTQMLDDLATQVADLRKQALAEATAPTPSE